jgi:hypothetical protein
MHLESFDDEPKTVALMNAYLQKMGSRDKSPYKELWIFF